MANNQRKAEKRKAQEAQLDRELQARIAEDARKAALSMWERIEEIKDISDVKDVLHLITEKLGIDWPT